MPKFQKRHYEAIADVLSAVRADADVHRDLFMMEACERFQEHVTRVFERDNPRFQPSRFDAAARRESVPHVVGMDEPTDENDPVRRYSRRGRS